MKRDLASALLACAKRNGQKVLTVTIRTPQIICVSEGCNEKFILPFPVSFEWGVDGRAMALAYPCPKCGRLYASDRSPLVWKSFNNIFLNKNGYGVVRNGKRRMIYAFWASGIKSARLGRHNDVLVGACA